MNQSNSLVICSLFGQKYGTPRPNIGSFEYSHFVRLTIEFLFMNLFCSEKPPPTDLYHPLIEGEKMGGFLFFVLLAVMISGGCATSGDQSEQAALISDRRMVLNRTWQWVATVTPVEKITVSTPERYTIRLTQ